MKKTLVPLLVFVTTFAFGQIKNISINISPNYSLINSATERGAFTTYQPETYPSSYGYTQWSIKQNYKGKTGVDFNAKADYTITKRLFVSAGLSFNYLRYDQNIGLTPTGNQPQFTSTNTGVPFGTFYGSGIIYNSGQISLARANKERTTSYVSVPVMIGYSFLNDRLLVRTGPALSLLLNATHYNVSYGINGSFSQQRESSTNGYHQMLVNLNTQVTYRVFKYFGIDFSYQQGLTSIYSDNTRSRYHTVACGVSYIFDMTKSN